jgi:hypothetical protein
MLIQLPEVPWSAPADLTLVCPAAAAGQNTNPFGTYDPASVASAVAATTAIWAVLIVALAVACYQSKRMSLGPSFVKRWWLFLAASAAIGALAGFAVLTLWPTIALAASCQSDPSAFQISLPGSFVSGRTVSAGLYGALLFIVLSVLLTQTVGRIAKPWNGFFHNRGCPWPRIVP